ncbi:MAG: hypothetical protein HRU09_20850 [Oligoflexales bacterium]|nr:hypothetical protein [Oligoflexales bacterium]
MKIGSCLFFSCVAVLFLNVSMVNAKPNIGKLMGLSSLLSFTASSIPFASAGICPLCETAGEIPVRLDHPIDCNSAYTCLNLYIDLAQLDETNPECLEEKAKHQASCCNVQEPEQNCPPTSAPIYDGPVGNEPDCPICGTLEFPGNPNALILARYVGEYTCAQLYDRGLHGMTPGFICGPLQDYAEEVCGCGQHNPACIEDETQCWGYEPAPTDPTLNPTPFPTMAPSSEPSDGEPTQPTLPQRKPRPKGSKYGNKLSGGLGGAAGGRTRNGCNDRRMMRGSAGPQPDTPYELEK